MAFWDKILGGEKKEKSAEEAADLASKSDAVADNKATPQAALEREAKPEEKRGKGAGVLVSPHMTEKTTDMMQRGIYAFRVEHTVNKRNVAAAVTGRYGVVVDRVRIMTQPSKERKRGRQIGWKQGFKKAIVQLKEGQRIETL